LVVLLALILPDLAHAADRLYYFWSFSMPEESLKAAFVDGEKIGMIAVLRGLPDASFKSSMARLKSLRGDRKIEVIIDPVLFDLYQVDAAPTFVLASGADERHWKVVGDLTLRAALEIIARETPAATPFLKKLNRGFFSK
jgi:type-F conjugative transfer system pilin assembly protein TrbC